MVAGFTLETWTLWVHVAAGSVAVLAGVGALLTQKGGPRHRTAGKLFVASMAVVVGTVLLAFDPTTFRVFLSLVAVFSGYLAFSGYRALSRKRPADGATAVDWTAAGLVATACVALCGWGAVMLAGGTTFGVVLLSFGAIGLGFGAMDARAFRAGEEAWIVTHLQRMVGAFVATVSAVSAVNLDFLGVVAWLWPTVALTPLIVYWTNEYGPD